MEMKNKPDKDAFFKPGDNCWRVAGATRVAFLIDGAAYFAAFREAVARARQSVLIIGWDIDSRIKLLRSENTEDLPVRLGEVLNQLAADRPGLHINILTWDFAMIYALERDWLPLYKLQWRSHRRLHFRMDDKHPTGASHHQKIVVIDDSLAFVGGFDLSKCRWDTPEHKAADPRRVDPNGEPYLPVHDVQVMVEGEAAACLGELARARWWRALRKKLPVPECETDAWPENVSADMENVEVAIARTQAAYGGDAAIREVERLHLDAIAAAQRYIYIENQYLSSAIIGRALAERLAQQNGPEIVIVMSQHTGGWLEQATMDVLRARLLTQLRSVDRYDRLRLYYPALPGLNDNQCMIVHAKILVIDDSVLRVGSSNLSNRSMRLDSECDLVVVANADRDRRRSIVNFRNLLLAEHLGVTQETVAEAIARENSLITAIESLSQGERTLAPLDGSVSDALDSTIPEAALVDPERPLDAETLAARFIDANDGDASDANETASSRRRLWIKSFVILGLLLGLAALWRWSPLRDWLDQDTLIAWGESIKGSVAGHITVLAAFILASLTVFPITLLIVVTAVVFGPWVGFAYSLLGAVLGAAASYGVGYRLGRNTVRRIAGDKVDALRRRLAKRGVISVAVIRMLPIAPFTVVNVVAGASHIPFRVYLFGTLLGMMPGTAGLTVFADSVFDAVRNPQPANFVWIAAVVIVLVAGAYGIRLWFSKRTDKTPLAS